MKLKKSYRVSEENFKIIEKKAKLCNLTVSAYVEEIATRGAIVRDDVFDFETALTQMNIINELIEKILKNYINCHSFEELEIILDIRKRIETVIKAQTKIK